GLRVYEQCPPSVSSLMLADVMGIIRRLLAMDWEVNICYSYRKANDCADALANLGCNHDPGLRVYEQCPPSVSSLMLADVMGIITPKIISL
ncbi:ribonuclease H, partial [Trifolium pratense]